MVRGYLVSCSWNIIPSTKMELVQVPSSGLFVMYLGPEVWSIWRVYDFSIENCSSAEIIDMLGTEIVLVVDFQYFLSGNFSDSL